MVEVFGFCYGRKAESTTRVKRRARLAPKLGEASTSGYHYDGPEQCSSGSAASACCTLSCDGGQQSRVSHSGSVRRNNERNDCGRHEADECMGNSTWCGYRHSKPRGGDTGRAGYAGSLVRIHRCFGTEKRGPQAAGTLLRRSRCATAPCCPEEVRHPTEIGATLCGVQGTSSRSCGRTEASGAECNARREGGETTSSRARGEADAGVSSARFFPASATGATSERVPGPRSWTSGSSPLQSTAIRSPEPGRETVLSAPSSSLRTSSSCSNGRMELRLRRAPSRPSFRTSKWTWRYRISSLRTNAAAKRRLSSSATVFRRRRCRLSAASGLRFARHRRRLPASTLRGE